MIHLTESQACDICWNQSFLAEDDGTVRHPCCAFWRAEGSDHCVACRTSEGLAYQQEQRNQWMRDRMGDRKSNIDLTNGIGRDNL
jgi:hypothetical protein